MKMTDEELQAKFLYDNGTLSNKFAIKNADELSLIEYRGVAEREVALLQQQPKLKALKIYRQLINSFLVGFMTGRVSYVTTTFQKQVLIFWNMVALIMQLSILMMKLGD